MKKSLWWLAVWGMAFGYLEAAVVVYLRELYYPEGFRFPAVMIADRIMLTELLREAATLLIMWATVCLAYKNFQSRISAFIILFGVWDIFYYIFLKLLLNWPESINTWDILFLIPVPWLGPVWAPILVSLGFIYAGTVILIRNHQNNFLYFNKNMILLEFFSILLIIASFIIPGSAMLEQTIPDHFPWYLFFTGFIIGMGTFFYSFYTSPFKIKNREKTQ
jgi:hypothetical protein